MNKESVHLTIHNLGLLKPRLNTAPQSVSDRSNLCRIPHWKSILLMDTEEGYVHHVTRNLFLVSRVDCLSCLGRTDFINYF